jgi:glutaredoxin
MMIMARATIYTAPECPHSKRLKEFLSESNVDFDEKSVVESPDLLKEVKELTGQMAVPVLVVDDNQFVGFDRRVERRIKRKLGV